MEGKKILDGKVERKGKYGFLVEGRKWEGKKNGRKKNDMGPPIFFLSKMERKLIKQSLLKYNYLFAFIFITK